MFKFGLKRRASEAIRRAVRASLTTAYLHPGRINELKLNEDASAWLLTESYAHHLYMLGIIFSNSVQEKWATFEYFLKEVEVGFKESHAKDKGPNQLSILPILLDRFSAFDKMDGPQRSARMHYKSSAILISKKDANADQDQLAEILELSTKSFMTDASKMFS